MKTPGASTAIVFTSLLLICVPAFAVADEGEEDEYEEQDFLFFLEEAYTQEKGEWQFSLSVGYFDNLVEEETDEEIVDKRTDLWTGFLGVEYGITDRLQIELELPYLRQRIEEGDETNRDNSVGDTEFAVGCALIEEDRELPQLMAGLEVIAPTGNEDVGLGSGAWGWGPFVAVSKQVIPKLYFHANLAYQITNNAEEEGEKKDERELEYGIAAVYQPTNDIDLILELVGVYEKEEDDEGTERTYPLQLVPGIKYEFENELQLGAALAVGLNNTFDIGGTVKLQYEF